MDNPVVLLSDYQRRLLVADADLLRVHGEDLQAWAPDVLRAELTRKEGLPWIAATPQLVDHALFAKHSRACREMRFLPTFQGQISLHVMMPEPFHGPAIRELRNLFHREIHPIGVSQLSLERTLSWLETRVPPEEPAKPRRYKVEKELLSWNYSPHEGVKFIERLLNEAYVRNASDVFIEPYPDRVDIRFKTSAGCLVMPPINAKHSTTLLADAKAFSSMSTREARGYRDGSAELVMYDGNVLNFRAVAQKTLTAEAFTFRLLDKRVVTSLTTTLPFPPKFVPAMRVLLGQKQGMILLCGPTGSGKTTTLWRCLLALDSSRLRVMSLEDPPEYRFDRFVQLPVKGRVEGDTDTLPETFGAGVRSCMRAAPDVLLIGEMRDRETAHVGAEAALTGHLVFSTVHSQDSIGAIPRLLDLKVSALNVRQTILAIVAQRLAPRLCPSCRIPSPTTPEIADHYTHYALTPPERVFRAGGCPECSLTGIAGKMPVLELLILNEELRARIRDGFDELEFRKAWREAKGQSLAMHALELAAAGDIAYSVARALDPYHIPASAL